MAEAPSHTDAPPLSDEDRELLDALSPEMARMLYPDQVGGPVRVTLVYPRIEGSEAEEAARLEAAAEAHESDDSSDAEGSLQRTHFTLRQLRELSELYHLVERAAGTENVEIRVNGHTLPLVRELWLPLLWTLRS